MGSARPSFGARRPDTAARPTRRSVIRSVSRDLAASRNSSSVLPHLPVLSDHAVGVEQGRWCDDGLRARRRTIQGPLQAGLVFGVGRADESMLVAGITHVVEHLAFQRLGHLTYFHNGTVDSVCTRFFVAGDPEDVVRSTTASPRVSATCRSTGSATNSRSCRSRSSAAPARRSVVTCRSGSARARPASSDGRNTA